MTAVERVLSIAAKEVGVKENPAGSNKVKYNTWFYGKEVSGSAYAWCCVFVCWVFSMAGCLALVRSTGGCTTMMNWFRGKILVGLELKEGDTAKVFVLGKSDTAPLMECFVYPDPTAPAQ